MQAVPLQDSKLGNGVAHLSWAVAVFFLMRRQQTQALTHEGSDDADSRFGCTGLNRKHMILFWATFVM